MNQSWHMTLWKNIMERVHEGLPYKDFTMPASVQQKTICTQTGLLATSSCPALTEYFAEGTVPSQSCSGHYVAPSEDETEENDDDSSDNDDSNDSDSGNGGSNGNNSGGSNSGNNSGGNNSGGDNSGGNNSGDNSGNNSGDNSGGSGTIEPIVPPAAPEGGQ